MANLDPKVYERAAADEQSRVLELALQCGAILDPYDKCAPKDQSNRGVLFTEAELLTFYQRAQDEALERAARICNERVLQYPEWHPEVALGCARAIRAAIKGDKSE